MNEFQDALEGKISTADWTAEKLVEYHKFLQETTTKEKGEVGGLREAKRAETDRVEKLKLEATTAEERIAKAKTDGATGDGALKIPEMTQFRTEQVEKAKTRLFSEVKLTEEEKTVVLEKFGLLDSGKVDADFIYQDLLSAFAASNPTKFLTLSKAQEQSEQEAADETERQAGSGGSAAPAGQEPKKFSDEAMALAKKAGITPEAAQKQVTGGMTRIFE